MFQVYLDRNRLLCSFCGYTEIGGGLCPSCGKGYLKPVGVGIERLASIVKKIFPQVAVERLEDRSKQAGIVLSTSKIAGYEGIAPDSFDAAFVLDIDRLISRVDYNATLDAFIYLKKIVNIVRDKVYVFTHSPRHYLWQNINQHWRCFYDQELSLRKKFGFPPYMKMVKITLRSPNKKTLLKNAQGLYNSFKQQTSQVFGPIEDVPFKLRDSYRYLVVAKFKNKRRLLNSTDSIVTRYRRLSSKLAVVIE